MNQLTKMYVWFLTLMAPLKSRKGQTLVEYALILVFIAIVIILAATFLGERTSNVYSRVANSL